MALQKHCIKCIMMAHIRKYSLAGQAVPRITMPHNIINRIDRLKAKESAKKHQEQRFYKGPLIISCKRKEFNHYRGQTYSDFSPEHLASGGWKHRKAVGDYFTINAYEANPAIIREGEIDFATLGLNHDLVRGLEEQGITTPTNIQALTIPHLMEGKNVLCAAETGSGKTLAFLLPILHKIAVQRKMYGQRADGMNSPYAVILTPARELADQIYSVAEGLAPYVDCKPAVFCGGRGTQKILRDPPQLVSDIVISTPGVFSKLFTNRIFSRDRLTNIVLDEADTLLDDSFSPLTLRLLEKLKITSERLGDPSVDGTEVAGMQIAMVGATMPRNLAGILGDVVPTDTVEMVTTTSLHRLMPHVPQKFLRVNTQLKQEELLKAVSGKRAAATLIFCNKSSTANYLGHFLADNDVPSEVFHANMPQKVRNGRFDRLQDGTTKVLIATDIASRGLDTLRVQHVVNYDFPQFMSDYIHRVGRVGRVGSHSAGSVLSFVTHPWDVILLWKIESAARRKTELPSVNANIKQRLTEIVERKYHGEVKKEIVL